MNWNTAYFKSCGKLRGSANLKYTIVWSAVTGGKKIKQLNYNLMLQMQCSVKGKENLQDKTTPENLVGI